MRTLKESMELVGQCHLAWLNPEKGLMPTGGWEVAHDTGRWWDAMLRLENTIDFVIPEKENEAMLSNIKTLMWNKYGLLLNNPKVEWLKDEFTMNCHNFREGILSLTALVKYRNDEWAKEKGHQFIKTLSEISKDNGKFNLNSIAIELGIIKEEAKKEEEPKKEENINAWSDETASVGRALEGIILFYQETKDPLALDLAKRIAEGQYINTLNEDGSIKKGFIAKDAVGHNHSYCGTLRGLFMYGMLTGEEKYMEAVEATYRNSIWKHNTSWSGWCPHDLNKMRFSNEDGDRVGEHGSCADIIQLALWFAIYRGHEEYLDDVERLIRARLLPGQGIDENDPRNNGAWGVYGHPFGFSSILDVFAAVLHTLTAVYKNVVTISEDGIIKVNMNFDISTSLADVQTKRKEKGYLKITPKQSAKMHVRIPTWAKNENVKLKVGDKSLPLKWKGYYLIISLEDVKPGVAIEIEYDLPLSTTVEVMKLSGKKFELKWRGDEVISCEPKVPIYPNIP